MSSKTNYLAPALGVVFVFTLFAHRAFADQSVQCGAILSTPNVAFKLKTDLNCSGTAITIGANNVRLDLNGFSITGDKTGDGIAIQAVSNVSITNHHKFGHMSAIRNFSNGIHLIQAQRTSLNGVTLDNNVNYGIYLEQSKGNALKGNIVSNNGEKGVYLYNASDDNWIIANNIQDNGQIWGADEDYDDGLNIDGSSSNHVIGNAVLNNREDGIQVTNGSSNEIKRNDVNNNGRDGIFIRTKSGGVASSNGIYENRVENNGYGVPAVGGGGSGIVIVAGPTGNTVQHNMARFNLFLSEKFADVADLNASCNNIWTDNTFDTKVDTSGNCVQ